MGGGGGGGGRRGAGAGCCGTRSRAPAPITRVHGLPRSSAAPVSVQSSARRRSVTYPHTHTHLHLAQHARLHKRYVSASPPVMKSKVKQLPREECSHAGAPSRLCLCPTGSGESDAKLNVVQCKSVASPARNLAARHWAGFNTQY